MRQFGLIGYPLSHSFSKKYFTQKFAEEGIHNCSYELYPITSINDFPTLLQDVAGLEGINVTIPYKEAVLPFLHEQSAAVKEIGACNCIQIKDGNLIGHNTDVTGFRQSIEPFLQAHHQHALILGTGGAAKAVALVLPKLKGKGFEVGDINAPAGEVTMGIRKELTDIQYGRIPDRHGWLVKLRD